MPANLNLATLRTFVLIAQGRTFGQASEAVCRSLSAVSLQIQRLETEVGAPLLLRNRQGVSLTLAGERFLLHAQRLVAINDEAISDIAPASSRTINFGVTLDLAETILPRVLAHFSREHPSIDVALRIDRSRRLADAVRREELDLAVALALDDTQNHGTLAETPMSWIAQQDFAMPTDARLPLALFEPPCGFRAAALDALGPDRPFRVAATSPNLGGIVSSVRSGHCVTVRTKYLLSSGLEDVGRKFDLPPLPSVNFSLYARPSDRRSIRDDLVQICRHHLA